LLRPHSHGLVSCRIRPWGCSFQRFPPSQSRHSFRCTLPSSRTSPSSAPFPLRSEERRFCETLVSRASNPLRRMSSPLSPIATPGSGFVLWEGPFTTKRFYPDFIGRSSPSLHPLRGILPSSLGLTSL
jgi:hypothetical protein